MIKAITPSGIEIKGIYKIEFYAKDIIYVNDDIIVKEVLIDCPDCGHYIKVENDTTTVK